MGDLVFLTGQVAEEPAPSVREQTVQVLAQIDALLEEAGSARSRLLMVNIWLADIDKFDEMNAAWDAWVPQDAQPARATVEARLAGPEYLVEIAVIAATL